MKGAYVTVSGKSGKFSKEQLIDRAFYRVAWNIHHMWSEAGFSDTRLMMEPILREELVLVGKSKNGSDRKEHVVPRLILCDEAHAMYERGASIEAVAAFLKKFLKVVLISKAEQEYLDNTLRLKQRMPDGWDFKTGDPFARLHAANIEFDVFA